MLSLNENKAKAISAKLLELNSKNKLDEKRKKTGLEETERNGETEEKTRPMIKTMTYLVFFFYFVDFFTHLISFYFRGRHIFWLKTCFF